MKKKKRNNRSSLHPLNFVQVEQPVDYRIDCYSCRGVYLQFIGDITAMGGDCMHRQVKCIGNLLVAHSFGDTHDNFFLALAQDISF